jgi:hypothetical protein
MDASLIDELWDFSIKSSIFTAGGLQGDKCTLDIRSQLGIIEPTFSELILM